MSGAERVSQIHSAGAAAMRRPVQPSQDDRAHGPFPGPRPADSSPVWPCLVGVQEPVHIRILERRLEHIIVQHPLNMELKTTWIVFQRGLAQIEMESGQHKEAARRLDCASKALNEMLCFDPTNEMWLRQREALDQDLSNLAIA